MPRGRNRTEVRFAFQTEDNASAGIDNIRGSMQQLGGSDGASGILGGLNIGFGALAGAAAAAGAALAANTGRWAASANQQRRSAELLNVQLDQYSELHFAFEQFGYDATDLDSILAELEIKTYDWRDGVGGVVDAFTELGLELDEFDRLAPDEKLDAVAAALARVESNSRRVGIADTIFGGDDARKVLDVAASLDTLTESASEFGVTIDNEGARTAERFQEVLRTLEGTALGVANSVGEATAGLVVGIAEGLGVIPREGAEQADAFESLFRERRESAQDAGHDFAGGFRAGIISELVETRDGVRRIINEIALDLHLQQTAAAEPLAREGALTAQYGALYLQAAGAGGITEAATTNRLRNRFLDAQNIPGGARPNSPEEAAILERARVQLANQRRLADLSDVDLFGDTPGALPDITDIESITAGSLFPFVTPGNPINRFSTFGPRPSGGTSFAGGGGGGRGSYGAGGGGAGGSGNRINITLNFHFGEGVVTDTEIIESVQTGINYREIATDIGERVAAACA